MLGHHRPASETPLKWTDDDPLLVLFGTTLLSSSTAKKQQKKKKNVIDGPPLTKLSESAHVLARSQLF